MRYKGKIANFIEFLGARKEAETIGQLLGVQPLLGERATREVVLQAIYPVSLIRVVAHGNADIGEIALCLVLLLKVLQMKKATF